VILVMEPDAQTASALVETLHLDGPVRRVERFDEALSIARGGDVITLLVVHAPLVDGAWDVLLEEVRARDPHVPALVVSDVADAAIVRRAFALDATFTCAPVAEDDLLRFARRRITVADLAALPEAMRSALEAIASKYQLRAQQLRVVHLALEGRSRREIARALLLSENTVKSQIRDLLKRCRARSLAELCREALREALSRSRAGANRDLDPAAT
jgi:DNA-binding NarL/FixJ family response regulator